MKDRVKFLCLNLLAACLLCACSTTPNGGPNYYLLSSGQLESSALQLKSFKLALGPIEVPAYLNRVGIATHEGPNRVIYSDNHRWAESLNVNLVKALHTNLAQLLPNQQLIDFPYRQSNRPDYQLSVSIEKFGYVSDGSVVLQARSALVNSGGRQIDSDWIDLKWEQSDQEPAAIVSKMSELLGEMSVQMAGMISENI